MRNLFGVLQGCSAQNGVCTPIMSPSVGGGYQRLLRKPEVRPQASERYIFYTGNWCFRRVRLVPSLVNHQVSPTPFLCVCCGYWWFPITPLPSIQLVQLLSHCTCPIFCPCRGAVAFCFGARGSAVGSNPARIAFAARMQPLLPRNASNFQRHPSHHFNRARMVVLLLFSKPGPSF